MVVNGAVTSVLISNGGSGYTSAPTLTFTGHGATGTGATGWTGTLTGGVVTGISPGAGGSGYPSAPIVYLYGTEVSGNTVTTAFNFQYVSNPASWSIPVALYAANTSGTWPANCNPYVAAPNVLGGGAPVAIDNTKPLATDDNVLAYLTTPTGRVPGVLRFMDVTQGYGGQSNYIDPADLVISGSGMMWWPRDGLGHVHPGSLLQHQPSPGLRGERRQRHLQLARVHEALFHLVVGRERGG